MFQEYPGHGDIKIKFGRKEHGGCSSFDGKGTFFNNIKHKTIFKNFEKMLFSLS